MCTMIPSAIARAGRPASSFALNANVSASRALAGSVCERPPQKHQRRLSSSKTPRSPDVSALPESTATSEPKGTTASSTPKSQDTNKSTRGRQSRRSSVTLNPAADKDGLTINLPVVPATNHLQIQDVHTATFFALDRPISITHPVPPEVSDAAFDAIFTYPPKSKMAANNIKNKNWGPTSQKLDFVKHILRTGQNPYSARDLRADITKYVSGSSEQGKTQIYEGSDFSIEDFVQKLVPFQPPPAPRPLNRTPSASKQKLIGGNKRAAPRPLDLSTKTPATNVVEDNNIWTAASPSNNFVNSDSTPVRWSVLTSFTARMSARRAQYNAKHPQVLRPSSSPDMWAISVQRQRRQKMKKHKFKKLQKRTRTIRRRERKI